MLKFKKVTDSFIDVFSDDKYIGELEHRVGWVFVFDHIVFEDPDDEFILDSDEFRQIADKLDELNGVNK